jgi:predicted nucleic acid-binding protein
VILADTGPLVAAADAGDADHRVCAELLTRTAGPILVPATAVAEACYLLERNAGPAVEASFLRSFATGALTVANLVPADFERMADLVDTYADLPLGGTDASVIALAERLGITTVMTLDQRHFRVVRPNHVEVLELVP